MNLQHVYRVSYRVHSFTLVNEFGWSRFPAISGAAVSNAGGCGPGIQKNLVPPPRPPLQSHPATWSGETREQAMPETRGTSDIFEAMSTMRAMRRLKPDPVPDELINKILQAGQWAPSGGNTQRWRFLVVKDPEI